MKWNGLWGGPRSKLIMPRTVSFGKSAAGQMCSNTDAKFLLCEVKNVGIPTCPCSIASALACNCQALGFAKV